MKSMNIDDKVSVIVPVYNSAKYLEKCITSILNQTHKNIEFILVDDGSVDESWSLLQHFQCKDARIIALQQTHAGQSVARNKALDLATGSFIMFVDSDDWIDADMIEKMLSALFSQSLDAVKCTMELVGSSMQQIFENDSPLTSDELYKRILKDEIGGQLCGWLYKAPLWQNIRLPHGRLAEDASVLPKVLQGRNISIIANAFYKYNYTNPLNSSNAKENKFKNAMDRAIMFFERIEWLNNINYSDDSIAQLLIKKAVGFTVGAIAIHKSFIYDISDIKYIVSFLKKYIKHILTAKNIDILRKICVIIIILSPKLFYHLKKFLPVSK